MIKITSRFLQEQNACQEGQDWWEKHKSSDPVKTINTLMDDNHHDWVNWLIVRCMTHEQQIKYAIFAAEQVLHFYEDKYPNDDRPRKAIEAAKEYLKYPDEGHRSAAESAARSARSAVWSAWSARSARSARSAWSAAESAWSAAWSAWSAAESAAWSAWSAAESAWSAARSAMLRSIIEYGISLLEEK